jgi:hypothetical protein
MKMGIGIGWPNATYQSGEKPFTAEIKNSSFFNIPTGGDYTIEFFAGDITAKPLSTPHVFFSFGENLTAEHSAFLIRTGTDWEFLYFSYGNLIISQVVTTAINTNYWNFFVIQRKDDYVWFGLNGNWVATSAVGSPSPAIPTNGLPMYIGSENKEGYILNGLMNNFRWTNGLVYSTGVPFIVPNSDLIIDIGTGMLVMQGYNLASSLVDQSGNNNDIIPGTNISYANTSPSPGMSGSLYFSI